MPREDRATTRQRLLEAAIDEFARRGIDGTSLDRIATTAGLTKGAIFSNFANKEELVFAVAGEYGVNVPTTAFLDASLGFEDQLRAFGLEVARMTKGASRRLVLFDRALQTYCLTNPTALRKSRAFGRAFVEDAAAKLDHALAQRDLVLVMPTPRFVAVLLALTRGLIESALRDPALLDEEYFADAFALLASSATSRHP